MPFPSRSQEFKDLTGKMNQGRANDRFSDRLAQAYFEAKSKPDIESRLYVDNVDEILLAFSILYDITKMLGNVDMDKTVASLSSQLARRAPERDIELNNGSVIKIAIKPEISKAAKR